MKYKGPTALGSILIIFFIYPYSDARQCSINCAGSTGNVLKFPPGKTYQYKLEGSSVTTLPGAKGDVSKLGIEANVEISADKGCEHVISLSNVKSIGPDGKKHNLDSLLSCRPLKFGLQNGKIGDLCIPEAAPSFHGVNINRAVLTLLQSSVLKETGSATQHETDIFGSCPTNFDFSKQGSSVVVRKTKNLAKCSNREDVNLPFSTSTYLIQSDLQTSPVLNSYYSSSQKFDGGILKSASSDETYKYNPLSGTDSGTTVKITTKLSLVGQTDKPAPAVSAPVGKSLLFEAEHPVETKGGVPVIVDLLKSSCESRIVESDGAERFSKLLKAMSGAPKEDLQQVYQQVKSGQGFKEKDIALKMFIDALVQTKSASSIELMAGLIKNKEVTGAKVIYFYYVMGYSKHVSRAALLSVTPLLDGNAPSELYLGAGALGGRFCREHNCEKKPEVEKFQTSLAAPLLTKGCKPANKKDEDILLASLKGLGNMGYHTKPVVAKLVENAGDKGVKARIRVALLEAMRKDANKPEFKKVAGEIFKDTEEDSEIRIKAYLVLAECPCGKVAALIKDVLENEKSFQVGTFVTSHLRNVRASTNPEKAGAKHHLGSIIPPGKYPIDPRKYSQNCELSYSVDMLNLGASVETNTIYSQKSYLPRSLSFNLTSHLFGHSVNWLEFGVRTENLEKVIEQIFGPRGKFRKQHYNDVYEEGREYATSLLERVAERYEKSIRPKRSVTREQLNTLANKVKMAHESEDDLDIDVSLKLYGAELLWLNLHGMDDTLDTNSALENIFDGFDSIINSAKNLNFDYRKHFVFLDEDYIYPTALGLPLKMKALGNTVVRLKADGKIDIPALLKDPDNTDVRLQFIPSAAVEVRGDIVIDGVALESGVKVTLNLHSSTGTDMTFRMLDGRGVDIKFGLPINKQEILTIKTDVTSLVREVNKPENNSPIKFDSVRAKYSGDCFDQLSEVLGLTVCGELDTPVTSILPSHGPAKMSFHVDKDPTLTHYHFKAYGGVGKEPDDFSYEVLFDTPNTKVNRKIALTVEGTVPRALKVNMKSPWTTAALEGAFIHTDKELSVNARLAYDDIEYALRTGALKSKQGNVVKFEPILEYKAPEQAKSALVGRRGGPKPASQVVTVSGAIIVETKDNGQVWKFENLALNTPRTKYSIDGSGSFDKESANLNVAVNYDKENVKIIGNYKIINVVNHNSQLSVVTSQYPDFNLNVKWDVLKDTPNGKYESKLTAIHGPDPKSEVSKLFIHNKLEVNKKEEIYAIENTVSYPVVELDGHVGFKVTPKSFKSDLKGKFDKYSAQLLVKGDINTKKEGDYNAEIRWELMGNSVDLTMSRKVLKNHQSKFTNVLEIKPGGKYELSVHATHKVGEKDVDLTADVDIILPADPKNIKVKAGLKSNDVETKSHLNAMAGNKPYIQSEFNLKTGDKPSGNFKIKVTEYINSHGDFVFDGSNFKAKTKIDLPKVQRQMEGKANFVISKSRYNGGLDFCWDTKNPEKTLKLQTDTTVQENSVESKNSLTIAGKKSSFNLKGSTTGEDVKGTVIGEVELVLSCGNRFHLSLNDNHDISNDKNLQGETVLQFSHQLNDQQQLQVTLKTVGKNIDIESLKFDGQVSLAIVDKNKKELSTYVILKRTPKNDDTWLVKGEITATGNILENPLTLKFDTEHPDDLFDDSKEDLFSLPAINYHLVLTNGPNVKVETSGKIGGNTLAGDLSAKLPEGSPLTSLKWSTNNVIDVSNDDKRKLKTSNELHWNKDKFIKFNGESICEENSMNFEADWETNTLPKRKLTGSAHVAFDDTSKKADANAALVWEGKTADMSVKLERNKDNVGVVHFIGNTPEHGKVDLLLKNKIVKNDKGLHSDLILTTKDKKIAVSSKLEFDDHSRLIDVVMDHPDGKSRFFFKLDNKGERHWVAELKAKWTVGAGGSLAWESEYFLKSVENFYIKHMLDYPKVDLSKVQIDLSNKPGRSDGKKITLSVKKDDKIVLSASSNYVIKQDGDEYIIEGGGNLKVKEETFPLTFKGTWIVSDSQKAVKVNVKAGKYSVNVEGKHDENEFNLQRTVCQDKECSTAQILNKVRSTDMYNYEHMVIIKLDLHFINPWYLRDISYVGNYKRKDNTVDHLVEIQYDKEVKFKYKGFVLDKESGVLITFPKRTVGVEVKFDYGSDKKDVPNSLKFEVDLYLNKEKDDKLCFLSTYTHENFKNGFKVSGETKVTHPTFKKDLSVKGHYAVTKLDVEGEIVLDVFKRDDQKININLKTAADGKKYHTIVVIKSPGCKLDILYDERFELTGKHSYSYIEKFSYVDSEGKTREAAAKLVISDYHQYLLINLPAAKLLELDVNWKKREGGKGLEVTGQYDVASRKSKENLVYNYDTNRADYYYAYGDGEKIDIVLGILMGKSADLKVGLNGKAALQVDVALDEANFLKSNYNYDSAVIDSLLQSIGKEAVAEFEQLKDALVVELKKEQADTAHFLECLTECIPDFTKLSEHIQQELKQMKDEAMSDESIAAILNRCKEGVDAILEHVTIFIEELNKLVHIIGDLITEFTQGVVKVFKEVGPKIIESLDNITKMCISLLEQNFKLLLQSIEKLINELKKYQDDIDAVVKVFSDIVHDVGKQFAKVVQVIHEEIQKFIELNLEQLKELPITNMIKEKFEELKELKLPEEALLVIDEMLETLKQILPTPECEDFVSTLSAYLSKVLKQEDVDYQEAGRDLYAKLMKATKSLIAKVSELGPHKISPFHPEKYVTLPVLGWIGIPTGRIRVNILDILKSPDFVKYLASLETFAPSLLDPLDNIPPFKGIAHIIDSTEIITFDGRHYGVKGLCSYVLAEDYVDRNFSVVGHFKEGTLEAITVWSGEHSVTLRKNIAPLLDGKESEYPIRAGLLKAWITPTYTGLRSKPGMALHCLNDLTSCSFTVSGFYFNKLRGLFGNFNYEKYDDLVLPEGKFGSDPAQFCNSWKVDNACPDVPAVPHTHARQSICTDLFVHEDSDLILGRPWLPMEAFRDACDHLVQKSGDKHTACTVAISYVYHARAKGAFLLELPSECVICDINNKKISSTSTRVVPEKAADIVVLVDVLKESEEVYKNLIQPLVPQLKIQLQKNGISDVHVTLASFNSPTNRYTNFHTSNGELKYTGSDCVIEFEEGIPARNGTWLDRVVLSSSELNRELGNTQPIKAYEDVLSEFNFRPNAFKSIVALHSKPCDTGSFLNVIIPVRLFVNAFQALDQGVVWNLILPTPGLKCDDKLGVHSNEIVGFNDDEIYTMDKGPVKGEAEAEVDYCLDAAQSTGGLVFSSTNFLNANKQGKAGVFIQKTAENIAKSMLNAKTPLECECGLHHSLIPKPECELDD